MNFTHSASCDEGFVFHFADVGASVGLGSVPGYEFQELNGKWSSIFQGACWVLDSLLSGNIYTQRINKKNACVAIPSMWQPDSYDVYFSDLSHKTSHGHCEQWTAEQVFAHLVKIDFYRDLLASLINFYRYDLEFDMGIGPSYESDIREVVEFRSLISRALSDMHQRDMHVDLRVLRKCDELWQGQLGEFYARGGSFVGEVPFSDEPAVKWWCHLAKFDSLSGSDLATVFVEEGDDDGGVVAFRCDDLGVCLGLETWLDCLRDRGCEVVVEDVADGVDGVGVRRRWQRIVVRAGWCVVRLGVVDGSLTGFGVDGFVFPQLWLGKRLTDAQIRELTEAVVTGKDAYLWHAGNCGLLTININERFICGIGKILMFIAGKGVSQQQLSDQWRSGRNQRLWRN
ncbi:hypothetical protein JOD55_000199 [Arcanobacterium pluranimalium]|uniref:hypothetical protein n=1 Tax=Arcanobacterium pluranimalium TaxID=108028 RepID=UPI00195DF939|nr:hypothetical protein [Arcanobacterium pluranimalium]MBM7824372.1 hypothetical protein [Arcanobacterium pluranimalium]